MSAHTHETHDHDPSSSGVYVKTLIALLFLTVVTVAASYVDFGAGNVIIALFIATIKATLVALFFMHLRYEKPVNAVVATAGFLFLGIFLMFCFIDFDSRQNLQPVNLKPPVLTPAPAGSPAAAAEGEKK